MKKLFDFFFLLQLGANQESCAWLASILLGSHIQALESFVSGDHKVPIGPFPPGQEILAHATFLGLCDSDMAK